MLFQKKLEQALKWQKEKNQTLYHPDDLEADIPCLEDLAQEEQEVKLEKSDGLALLISALITFVPLILIILLALVGLMFLLS